MKERVKAILAEVLNMEIESISDDAAMSNIANWDSLNHMLILKQIEQAFEFKITLRTIQQTLSLDQILEHIKDN